MKLSLKHIYLYSLIGLGASTLASCDSFLDREPITSVTPEAYFSTVDQVGAYVINYYSWLQNSRGQSLFHDKNWRSGMTLNDNNTDNLFSQSGDLNYFAGEKLVPSGKSFETYYSRIRTWNWLLEQVLPKEEAKSIQGDEATLKHYIGEAYFFRALAYYQALVRYGDMPIIEKVLTDDAEELKALAVRAPRNEVARFILKDLDTAISRLQDQGYMNNQRINKQTAQLLKSRVALFEATFERYHQGTGRVPGDESWPGKNMSYNQGKTFNIAGEIDFFLTEAMASAKEVAEAIQISDKIEDYMNMFNQYDLSSNKEVLLWRMYSADAKVNSLVEGNYHSIYNENGEGCVGQGGGYTRSMVETFLTTNGLPIYAPENTEYKGDKSIPDVMENRDLRLVESTFKPGDMVWRGGNMDQDGRMVYANLLQAYQNLSRTATGYLVRKGWRDSNVAPADNSPLAYMIFRASEAYLNYMEADYMKNKNLDDYSKKYWRALRKRAGVSENFQKTIDATDLSKENDLAVWSGSQMIDKTLYNIRRERRCEFIAEGMRKDDLLRWRSLDKMKNYQTEGFNWQEYQKEPYYVKQLAAGLVVSNSKYLRPHFANELIITNNGYNFEEANYLTPISYDVFRLSTPEKGGDISTSVVYQNPGWPVGANQYALQ